MLFRMEYPQVNLFKANTCPELTAVTPLHTHTSVFSSPSFFYVTVFFGHVNKHLLTPVREPITDQSKDPTGVQLGEPMSSIEVTYRNVGEGFLTGGEMTPRFTKSNPSMGDSP